jgi:hypothetical protein
VYDKRFKAKLVADTIKVRAFLVSGLGNMCIHFLMLCHAFAVRILLL